MRIAQLQLRHSAVVVISCCCHCCCVR